MRHNERLHLYYASIGILHASALSFLPPLASARSSTSVSIHLLQAANLDATFEQRSQKQRAAAVAVQRHASVEAAQVAAAARLHPHALLQAQQAALLATCLAQVSHMTTICTSPDYHLCDC